MKTLVMTVGPSEAVYGFASWLSTRPGSIIVGAEYECTELAGLCKQWCDANDLPRPRDEYCPDNLEKRLNDNL